MVTIPLTLLATAFAQAMVVLIALIAGKQEAPHSSVAEIEIGFFVGLWLGSAMLFRSAAVAGPKRHYQLE